MWLPFALHKIEKPGQGMRARWFAFIALMLLVIWGCQSSYRIMYVSFDWRHELPDPSFDYLVAHPSPQASTLRTYGLSMRDGTLVMVKTAAELGDAEPPPTFGGIPVSDVQITFNESDPIGKVLRQNVLDQLNRGDGSQTRPEGQPQTAPATRAEENRTLANVPWKELVAMVANGPRLRGGKDDDDTGTGKVLVSGPGTGIFITVPHPLPDEPGRLNIDNRVQFIVPIGEGMCSESGQQLDGVGVPWAAVTMLLIGFMMLLIVRKVTFGTWASSMLIETDQELNKVHWPTVSRVYNSSVIVVICTMVFAVLLFGADLLLNNLLRKWLELW